MIRLPEGISTLLLLVGLSKKSSSCLLSRPSEQTTTALWLVLGLGSEQARASILLLLGLRAEKPSTRILLLWLRAEQTATSILRLLLGLLLWLIRARIGCSEEAQGRFGLILLLGEHLEGKKQCPSWRAQSL